MQRSKALTLKKVAVNLPFELGSFEWEIDPVEREAAWELYIELMTRSAVQPLDPGQGLLREALDSLYSLFATTRAVLRKAGPNVGVARRSVGGLALAVLNNGLRPFLVRWHPLLQSWEAQRPRALSIRQHEDHWHDAPAMRAELEALRKELAVYAEALATIAGVSQ